MFLPDRWYAVQVRPRFERVVDRLLAEKAYESFVPLYKCRRRWSDRVKVIDSPLFAGYVFCRVPMQTASPILTTPGVVRIVGAGNQPLPIETSEINALRQVVASGAFAEPWPFVRVGQTVEIETGPLAGVRGLLVQVRNATRVVVTVMLLRRSVAVEVDRTAVRPVPADAPRATPSRDTPSVFSRA